MTNTELPTYQLRINTLDRDEMLLYVHAPSMKAALVEIGEKLRGYSKYGLPEKIKTAEDAVELIRRDFYEVLEDHDINN